LDYKEYLAGFVSFHRKSMQDFPDFRNCDKTLNDIKLIVSDDGLIEDSECSYQKVDFANKFIGGGVLHRVSSYD
jgi:hypothetical protein